MGCNMPFLPNLTREEHKFIQDCVDTLRRSRNRNLSKAEWQQVVNRAKDQVLAQRESDRLKAIRHEEAAQRDYSWKRPGHARPFIFTR